jgi:precorrin-6A/cobalt-precorrin-6A reductase
VTADPASVLVLGGTSEATELTRQLTSKGHRAILSFAGRTNPVDLPTGPKRIGGFGGVSGLVGELQRDGYELLVDATHPFATTMAHNALEAAGLAGVPSLRLLRPPWEAPLGATWHEVDTVELAAGRLAALGARQAFLAIGAGQIGAFAEVPGVQLVVRTIEPPSMVPSSPVTVLLARGPFTVDAESALLLEHRIDVLVARNSGGLATAAKLEAANRLGIPVIMVRRPGLPEGERVATVAEALVWVDANSRSHRRLSDRTD